MSKVKSDKYPLLFKSPILSDWAFRVYLLTLLVLVLFLRGQPTDSTQISPGQAAFDLIATTIDEGSMFDIDITDPEQRQYMFVSGEEFVGGLGKNASGAMDGLLRGIEVYVLFLPFLVWRRISVKGINRDE